MSEPTGPTGWDIAALIAGVIAVMGALGKAGAWLLAWGDRRTQARLDRLAREEDDLAESWSAFRKRVTGELDKAKATIADLERRDIVRAKENAALRVAFELVASGLRVLDPRNIALRQAEQILATTFPLDPQLPLHMTQALGTLDAGDLDHLNPKGE
jgi:hypothetical protein